MDTAPLSDPLLKDLNEAQRQAVQHTEGPVMIIAGAGSGKTRVITYRIAWLLKQGVPPWQIIALTFTNKAAREMQERIGRLTAPEQARALWMGTFHSLFARILRTEFEAIGFPRNFTIYDTEDSKSLIRSLLKELHLEDKKYRPNLVAHTISMAKNSLITADEYASDPDIQAEDYSRGLPMMGKIYQLYQKRLEKSAAMDFDDLLVRTFFLFKDRPDILYKYQCQFRYVMVDEYQDTNHVQYSIIRQLAAMNENICVVGDDAQSIYSFRGAVIENIFNFEKDYPDRKIFKLEQNYRSTATIVQSSNKLIERNKFQIKKRVWTENEEGEKIQVIQTLSDQEEGRVVAQAIFELRMRERAANRDFAVLYRTNNQSRALEEALRKLNIPYRIYGGLSFYQRKEVKDLLAYFRLAVNPRDEEALMRVINFPARGIGATTLDRLSVLASENDVPVWEILIRARQFSAQLGGPAIGKLEDFAAKIQAFGAMAEKLNALDAARRIAMDSGLMREFYSDRSPEGIMRYQNLEELINGVKEYLENHREAPDFDQNPPRLAGFLSEVALLTDADEKDKGDSDRVSLMTIHAAKGLEFPYVFVVGMEENLFPSQLSLNDYRELEEERRLFYVAITRAMKRLTLTYARTRFRWGNQMHCEPSRFLFELEQHLLHMPGTPGIGASLPREPGFSLPRRKQPENTVSKNLPTYDFVPDKPESFKTGMAVLHNRFGQGTILEIEGTGSEAIALIDFKDHGTKRILLKFAKMKACGSAQG
ncbi:MAG: UvrD-helicase domain-containing protein [Flavobacteriales bacterium]|nr:UvrD-helicase domain-containing protein [Flavobacteriales bacterium]MCX7649911.1 UvrD-helicase domain-containing protein [Flavobacteriales bacterium]MDW8431618.1 3'-5' exonuclease [Flavobacteriales bacterium]